MQDIARGVREIRERERNANTTPNTRPIKHADKARRKAVKQTRRQNRKG